MAKLSDSDEGVQELTESQVKGEHRRWSSPRLWLFPTKGRRRSIVEGEVESFDRRRDERMRGKSGRRGAAMMEKERSEQGEGRGRGDICNI